MKRAKRFLPALVIALVLSGTAVSQAQIICTIPCPTWDISAILRNTVINTLKKQVNGFLSDEHAVLVKMATRLAKVTPLRKYVIHMDDTPEWRIHDWFTGFNSFSNNFLHAMTYGDASGEGYRSVAAERIILNEPKFLAAGPYVMDALGADMAILDTADSVIVRGTHETGRLRFNGREEARTIDELQDSVTNDRDEESLTAVMDKISAAGVMEGRDKQARIQFLSALLEQHVVDSMRDRNQDAAALNMIANGLDDDGAVGRTLMKDATTTLRNWRQP